ncbi:MAG: hypothetical protein GKC10_02340 [Methanosarcinales archaeon]|nr:hypothetical protein [Methanosarcinales archaeon]
MREHTLDYQLLMKAVYAATSASGTVYPNDYNYVAISLDAVRSVLSSFKPGPWSPELSDSEEKARRLWYLFKDMHPFSACGIIRLSAPVPQDIVGVVTIEDLQLGYKHERFTSSDDSWMGEEMLYDDMLCDDISEYIDTRPFAATYRIGQKADAGPGAAPGKSLAGNLGASLGKSWLGKAVDAQTQSSSIDPSVPEMTLIDPSTKQIFKRSWGGTFGVGSWPISSIRAFAVWF